MIDVQKKIDELFDELEKQTEMPFFEQKEFMRFNKEKQQYYKIQVTYRRKRQELDR